MSGTNDNNSIIINNEPEDAEDLCATDSPRSEDEEPTEEDLAFIAREDEVEYEDLPEESDDTPEALLVSMDPSTREVFERTINNGSNNGRRRSLRLLSRSCSIMNHLPNEAIDDDDEDDEYVPSEVDYGSEEEDEDSEEEDEDSDENDLCADEGDVNQC